MRYQWSMSSCRTSLCWNPVIYKSHCHSLDKRVPVNIIIEYIIAQWSYSFACTLHWSTIIIMQTYLKCWTNKLLVMYILSSVCLSQFSQLSFMQYMGLCVFSLPISLMIIMRIRVLHLIIIIKSEIWPIHHCLCIGNETVVCTVCLTIFLCAMPWLIVGTSSAALILAARATCSITLLTGSQSQTIVIRKNVLRSKIFREQYTWASWHLQYSANYLFVQQRVQAKNKVIEKSFFTFLKSYGKFWKHVHTWQVSPQPSYGDPWKTWSWYSIDKPVFDKHGETMEGRKSD